MRKLTALLVMLLMFSISVFAVEQSHPFSQIITQGPDNEGIDIVDDMDMNDNPIHNTRALYIGGSGYSDGLAPGFIGHNSVEDRIALYSTTDKAVTVGYSPNAGIESDLLVTGDAEVDGNTKVEGTLNAGGVKIKNEPNYGPIIYNLDGLSFHNSDHYSVWSDDGDLNLQATKDSGQYVDVWDQIRLWGPSKISAATGDVTIEGDLEVTGNKNFVHEINSTHEAVYTSQESASARAVLEGTATVQDGSEIVELPNHFTEVVSDKKPDIKIQLTPRELTTVAATERSKEQFRIETGKKTSVKLDYRITGVREGFENPEVIQSK